MARLGVTYQDVVSAIDVIISNSDTPTIQKIRTQLGTGSPNTIHRHLTAWRAAVPAVERKAPELPVDLQAAIVKELERQAAVARVELEKLLSQAQAEAEELSAIGEQLEEKNDELTELNQQVSDDNKRLSALADERALEVDKLDKELQQEREAAESARIQLAQSLNKVELLNDQLAISNESVLVLNGKLENASSEKTEAEKEVAVLKAKLDAADDKIKMQVDLYKRLEKTESETITRHQQEIETIENRNQINKAHLDERYKEQIDELKTRILDSEKRVTSLLSAPSKPRAQPKPKSATT